MNHGMDSDETMEGAEDSPEQQPPWWVFLDAEKKKTETPDGKDFVTLERFFRCDEDKELAKYQSINKDS